MSVDLDTFRGSLICYGRNQSVKHVDRPTASAPCSPPEKRCFNCTDSGCDGSRVSSSQGVELVVRSCPVSPIGRREYSRSPFIVSAASLRYFLDCPKVSHGSEHPEHGAEAAGRDVDDLSTPRTGFLSPSPDSSSFHLSVDSLSASGQVPHDLGKRGRPPHDVDGSNTSHLPSKKRRIRYQLVTSRLSQPYSLPATHILNREPGEEAPILSRFLKLSILRAKKAGHEAALVRKAAIMNRIRLNVRQAAVNRGHERMWKMSDTSLMTHGLQVVTASTDAMFPGRGDGQASVPAGWRPHTGPTTPARNSQATALPPETTVPTRPPPAPRLSTLRSPSLSPPRPVTQIMNPLPGAEGDMPAFPSSEADTRYSELSDDDMDDVYSDFGVLFGPHRRERESQSGDGHKQDVEHEQEQYYEEVLDELDGIPWFG